MTTTWKCLLGAFAVCALFDPKAFAQVVEGDDVGVVRMQPSDPNPTQSANWLYDDREQIWLDDFQPPPGYGVDPVTVPQDNRVGYAVTSSVEDILYRIDRVNRNYHGLDGGWTGFNAFIPMRVSNGGTSLFAVDTRAFVSDYGKGGLNIGLVGRRYVDSQDRVYGLSGWLDYDDDHQTGYAQIGLHGSVVGRYWSARTNLQVPVGQSHERFGKQIIPSFFQDLLLLRVDTLQEVAYQQYDVELAVPTPGLGRFGFETGLQYYYLNGAIHGVEDGHGIGIRNEAQITEDVWLNAYVSSDTVFGSNLSVNLQVTLPNGPPSRFFRRLPASRYLVASDKRPYRVLTNTTRNSARSAAIDPLDGNPIRVAHIDPNPAVSALSGPVGTFENPFPSVAAFDGLVDGDQSGFDIILVRGREDDTDTNLNTTITLFDRQQLLGTGVPHFVDTTVGLAPLPDLPFGTPLLTNSAAPGVDVVTLADFNVVSGFTIDASGGTGDPTDPAAAVAINGLDLNPFDAGDPTGVRSFNINRNTIQGGTIGLQVVGESTVGPVHNAIIAENTFNGNGDAVDLDYSGFAVVNLVIEDNIISSGVSGLGFLPELEPLIRSGFDDFFLAANDDGSTALVPIGFNIDFFGQMFQDLFVNNNGNVTFTQALATFTPFPIVTNGIPMIAPFFADVDTRNHGNELTYGNDVIQGRNAFGVSWIDVDYFASSAAHGNQLNTFQLVMIDRSDVGGGDFDLEFNYGQILWETGDASGGTGGLGGSSARVGFTNGTTNSIEFAGSAVNGAFLDSGPAATSLVQNSLNSSLLGRYRFAVRNGQVSTVGSATGTGLKIGVRDDVVMNGSIARNTINGYQDGLAVNGPGNAVTMLNVSDNVISGAGRHGMLFRTTDNEVMTIFGARNVVTANGGDGLHLETFGNSTLTVDLENSQFDNNLGRGVKGTSFDDSTLNFALTSPSLFDPRSSVSNNGSMGIDFATSDNATANILIDDVLVDPNTDAGVLISAAQDSLINVQITNSEIINTVDGPNPDLFGDGIFLRTSGTAGLNGLVRDSVISGNAGHGFRVQAVETSTLDFDLLDNELTANGGLGIQIVRLGDAVVTGDIVGNLVDGNGGNTAIQQGGLAVRTDGTNSGPAPGTDLFILSNEFTNNVGGDGLAFDSFGASVLMVEAIGNLIDSNEVNGVRVTTHDGSFFGTPPVLAGDIGLPSIFDSNIVTNNGNDTNLGAGFLLQTQDLSTLVIDITSIEAAINPNLFERTLIAGNFDGIRAEHTGGAIVGDFALTSIRVGTAFAFPDPDIFEVEIAENTDDAIDIDILNSSGLFNINVSDTLMRGGRALGALVDPGVEIQHDSSFTIANIVFGGDISDAAGPNGLPRGPVRNPLTGANGGTNNQANARAGVVITDFADDGVNIVYSNSDSTGSQLNFRIYDSLIGQSSFGFNTGDGIDITVDNAGSPGGASGFDAIIDNTQIVGNGGHGIAMRTVANTGGLFSDGVDGLDGALLEIAPANQTDSNSPPNGIGDTIVDGPPFPNGDSTSDDFLNSLPFVLDPAGPNNGWADLTSPDDFVADLQIINGSRVDFNDLDGLHLEIGTATRQRVSLQNSSFSGNGDFEINIQTFASFEPDNDDIDRAEGMFDRIGLDPTAKLDFFFGSLNFVRDTPAGFPEPGPPVPAEFAAAVGGEGFNTSSSTRVNIDYLSTLANGFQNASTFKGAPRPANLFIRALIPDDPGLTDTGIPTPNRFLNFGQVFDEIDFFTGNLPASTFPDRYLDLNTP